jgi:hypothetical protein
MDRDVLELKQKALIERLKQWPSPEEITSLSDQLRVVALLIATGNPQRA